MPNVQLSAKNYVAASGSTDGEAAALAEGNEIKILEASIDISAAAAVADEFVVGTGQKFQLTRIATRMTAVANNGSGAVLVQRAAQGVATGSETTVATETLTTGKYGTLTTTVESTFDAEDLNPGDYVTLNHTQDGSDTGVATVCVYAREIPADL